ncbi:MAG: glycosyltransferase [Planctomycetes bacterium]|nr:glycosyltransferase [Planctomycetota bacterium]
MLLLTVALALYAAVALAYWLWNLYAAVRVRRDVPSLDAFAPPAGASLPRLSVVVAACNEAGAIEAAARTLLAQDYPDLEIILVDDRSTDATAAIIDRLAAEDDRVRALHVTALPEGWLGKVHALDRGTAEATGAYLLFTDADVHFAADALRRAVALCEARGLDHLAALPACWSAGLLVDAVVAAFLRPFVAMMRPWAVADPNSRAFLGVGAFNLVRRSAFERTPGFAWLRMETADDAGLGLLMKASGARCGVAAAFGRVGLTWYTSLGDAARGAEKAFASVGGCRLGPMLVGAAGTLAMEIAPLAAVVLAVVLPTHPAAWALAAVVPVSAAANILMARWARGRVIPALLGPLAAPISAAAFVRAGLLGWRRGGVMWRGTLYPSEAIRAGRRVTLPPPKRLPEVTCDQEHAPDKSGG